MAHLSSQAFHKAFRCCSLTPLLTLVVLLASASAFSLFAATARVNITIAFDDAAQQGPTTGIKVEPITPPWSESPGVVIGDPIIRASKTSPVIITNLFGSDSTNTAVYRVTITSRVPTVFFFKAWLTNGNAADLAIAAPGQSASWAAGFFAPISLLSNAITSVSTNFVRVTNGISGGITNLNFRSNIVGKLTNGTLTIDANGGSGGSGSAFSINTDSTVNATNPSAISFSTSGNVQPTITSNAGVASVVFNVSSGVTNGLVRVIDTRGHTNSGTVRFNGVTTIGTNQYLELRGQNDLGQDAFSVRWRHHHGLASPSWTLGSGITWVNPDESGFGIGNSLYLEGGTDITVLANGSAYVNTPIGLGYSNNVTNMLAAIGQSLYGSGNLSVMLGYALTNHVASSFDLGLADRWKITLSESNVYFRTRPYIPSLTASRFAYLNAQNTLTNSQYGEMDFTLASWTNTVLGNLRTTGSNNITKVDVQSGVANNLTISNCIVLTNLLLGPNTNCVFVVSNSSATGPGVLHLCKSTNGVIGASVWSVNLTNGFVGIGTNAPAQALEVQGNANISGNTTNSGTIAAATFIIGNGSVQLSPFTINSVGNLNIPVRLGLGSANLPVIVGAGGSSAGAAALSVTNTGGSQRATFGVFSSNNPIASLLVNSNGNVGIGTDSPLNPLHVLGQTRSTNGGHFFHSNDVTMASTIAAGMTNGGYWIGPISNSFQIAKMSNNVMIWKILDP